MKYGLVDSNNVLQNVIIYDGNSLYTPTSGLTIEQINDWIQIGENINTPQPQLTDNTLNMPQGE